MRAATSHTPPTASPDGYLERNKPNEICFRGTLYLSYKDGHEWVFTYGTVKDHVLHRKWYDQAMRGYSLRLDDIISLGPHPIDAIDFAKNADEWKAIALMETPEKELSPTDVELRRRLESEARARAFKKNPELAAELYGDEPLSGNGAPACAACEPPEGENLVEKDTQISIEPPSGQNLAEQFEKFFTAEASKKEGKIA